MGNVLIAFAIVVAGFACKPKGGGKTKVAVSIFPLHDITKRIAALEYLLLACFPGALALRRR